MIFRNSMWSILRSKGKTGLFTILIFALTLALALGVSVWASVSEFLDDCAEYYTTIGLVEYMGTDYPNDFANDANMINALESFDTSVLYFDEAISMWDESTRALGYIGGFWRTDKFVPERMNSVLVIGNIIYKEKDHMYSALVMDPIYSLRSRENTLIYIDEEFGTFEEGHFYLVFGEVYISRSPLNHLRAASFDNSITESLSIEIPRMVDITSDGTNDQRYSIPADSVLLQVANSLRVINNSVLVSGTNDLMSMLPFHQEELYIIDGRPFSEDEYAHGDRVAVISQLMAARLEIGVGDKIDLSVAVSDKPGFYNSYWAGNGFAYNASFEVIGIMNTVLDKSWYVYVPKSTGVPSSPFPIGYTIGHVIIPNDEAAAFYSRIEPVLRDRLQLTMYDQGYSSVAIPFQTILIVAKIVTAVSAILELAVVILFGFLYVYRQRETSETMLLLGTGKLRVCAYFLFSAGMISLIASAGGAMAGYLLHDGISSFVSKAAENYALIDSRYSNGNLTISRTLEFAPHLDWQLFLYVGITVFILTILACLGFIISTFINSRPSQKNLRGPTKERNTSHLGGGSSKYAFLSILRGGSRSMVVPLLAIAVVIFFGQLSTTSLRYQAQLNSIYDNSTIKGNFTDINGKLIGNLVINAFDVFGLYQSGQITDLSISLDEPYYFLGTSGLADGTSLYIPPLLVPSGYYAFESLEAEILRGPDLIFTNNIRTSPEFFYADNIIMHFSDGFDESFLSITDSINSSRNCLIPTSFMEERGIEFGDTIRVAINNIMTNQVDRSRIFRHFDLIVVGSYEKQGAEDSIYVPLSFFFDTTLIWNSDQTTSTESTELQNFEHSISEIHVARLLSTTFNSASFKLADTRSLSELKDYMTEYGYSQVHKVNKVREFIVIREAAFNSSTASIKQQIRYIDTLYPFLYALVGIIAIVVSYLMVANRKMELATMRGLGTTRLHSFISFFIEQSILIFFGTMIGLGIWLLGLGPPSFLHITLTLGFFFCYLLGSLISITILSSSNVLTLLTDRD